MHTDFQKMVLDSLAKALFSEADDSLKFQINNQLENLMSDFLLQEQSVGFNFDSLRFVKSVQPENTSFRLITWTVPLTSGSFLYSGFIQKIRKNFPVDIIHLENCGTEPEDTKVYQKDNWPSAVYTGLIEKKGDQGKFYTLIGWVGGKETTARRVLEVLTFDQDGNPVFGSPVFITQSGMKKHRVIFEFTDQIPFHLAYEQQRLPGKKNKKEWMIIFNHLSYSSSQYRNTNKAKIPNYDEFDAFIIVGSNWKFVSDIDVRMNKKDTPDYKPPAEIRLEPK